jgi:hypothetical protein
MLAVIRMGHDGFVVVQIFLVGCCGGVHLHDRLSAPVGSESLR